MTHHTNIEAAPDIVIRRATGQDQSALERLKEQALQRLLDPILTTGQRKTMRLITPFDQRLVVDGTYYVLVVGGCIAASGGWSRRAGLYGARPNADTSDDLLDPCHDAAGVRAMYTHPDFARCGFGALILSTALSAARIAGFRRARLLATPAGEKLYRASGWKVDERVVVGPQGQAGVPGTLMSRTI